MADEHDRPTNGHAEERLRRRLRFIAGIVILALVALLVIVDSFGRLLVDRDFHVSELIVGSLIGALLGVLGIEGLSRLPGGKG